MQLRDYQQDVVNKVYQSWAAGNQNVLAVIPTGGGKTYSFSQVVHDHIDPQLREQAFMLAGVLAQAGGGAACMIAHRQELVQQISVALANMGVYHNVMGTKAVFNSCMQAHRRKVGKDFLDPYSKVMVAGVLTLNSRMRMDTSIQKWAKTVTLVIQDEAHHVQKENQWGKAASHFTNPNLKGLYVTATPCRADGRGLSRDTDGVIDDMVIGPTMRDLINRGYLTDYRIFAPPSDLDLSGSKVGAQGDYSDKGAKAVEKSHVLGDVVEHYLRIARGKLAVAFVPSIEIANQTADNFNRAGVPALAVSGKTSDAERNKALRKFETREVTVLVNVDLFGEGFDLPAIEVAIFARPTMSYALFIQQAGRALRILEGKKEAIIIDHVGNVMRHGLPDAPKVWTLGRRDKKGKSANDAIPTTTCPQCISVYERVHKECPYCGYSPEPTSRTEIEFVDGDLCELTPEALEAMRSKAEAAVMDPDDYYAQQVSTGLNPVYAMSNVKSHRTNVEAQTELRAEIAQWGGWQTHLGRCVSEAQRRFYFKFGIDVMSAMTLKHKEANELKDKIFLDNESLLSYNSTK